MRLLSLDSGRRNSTKNLPRRRLRRLALTGFSRFCGSLALRTFQCSPLRGSAFQCCAYCSFCLQITPQRSLSAPYRVQLCEMGDFAEPIPPPLRDLLWPRRSSLGRAPRHSTKSPSPPFEAARPYGFQSILRKPCASGLPCGFAVLTPARIVLFDFLATLACPAIALATAEPAAGRALHLSGFTFYGEAGLMLHPLTCSRKINAYLPILGT